MRSKRFCPSDPSLLERRLLLTGDLITQTPATQFVGGAVAGQPTLLGAKRRVGDLVNQSFDNFTNDYLQAQSAYFSALNSATGQTAASAVGASSALFSNFITQRINLLAQELVQELARVPGTLHRLPASKRGNYGNSDIYLQAFLHTRITGATRSSLKTVLLSQLKYTPTSAGASTLMTLNATNAIETARTATLNAVGFVSNGNFGVRGHR